MAGLEIKLNQKEQHDKVQEISSDFLREIPHFQNFFQEVESGYNYLSGNHYTKAQRDWYLPLRRPTKTFNVYFNLFNQVLGDFFQNVQRQKVHELPGGTRQQAIMVQSLLDQLNSDTEQKSFIADAAAAGLNKVGWLFPNFSDMHHIEGSVLIDAVNEFDMVFESISQDYFLDDSRYLGRSAFFSIPMMKHLWPQHNRTFDKKLHKRKSGEGHGSSINQETVGAKEELIMQNHNFHDRKSDKYRVIEWRTMEYETTEVFWDFDTGSVDVWQLDGKRADLFKKLHPNGEFSTRTAKVKKTFYVLPNLDMMLEARFAELQDQKHDYVPFWAYSYGKQTIRNFGLHKNAKDPSDDFNEWKNVQRDLMNKHANPGGIWNTDKILNKQDIPSFGRMAGANVMVDGENTNLDKVYKLFEYSQLPFGPDALSNEAVAFLEKITGVTLGFQGVQEQKNESGILFANKVKQAAKAFIPIQRNWSRTSRRSYNKTIKLMQMNYEPAKIFSLTGKRVSIEEWRDVQMSKVELVIDDQDMSPTAKALRFLKKLEIHRATLESYGPQATDIEWLLKDADEDLGDMSRLMQRGEKAIQFIIGQMEAQAAATLALAQAEVANAVVGEGDASGNGAVGKTNGTPSRAPVPA